MDPTTEAMTADALTAAVTTIAFKALTSLSRRTHGPWRRRLRVAREGIPWVAPIVVAGIRAGLAASQGADPVMGFVRGFASGAGAVWIHSAAAAPGKVAEATREAPSDGAGG